MALVKRVHGTIIQVLRTAHFVLVIVSYCVFVCDETKARVHWPSTGSRKANNTVENKSIEKNGNSSGKASY